jgi:hypothetical protein
LSIERGGAAWSQSTACEEHALPEQRGLELHDKRAQELHAVRQRAWRAWA